MGRFHGPVTIVIYVYVFRFVEGWLSFTVSKKKGKNLVKIVQPKKTVPTRY